MNSKDWFWHWQNSSKPDARKAPPTVEPYSASTPTCAECKFWIERGDLENQGECHISAPTEDHTWPLTSKNDWCGEHTFADEEEDPKPGQDVKPEAVKADNVVAFSKKVA